MMICNLHSKDLTDSGLSQETITEAGLYCADREQVASILGWDIGCGGLVIPYQENGSGPFYRVKPDIPPILDGKPAKYLSPKKSANHLYIPPGVSYVRLNSKHDPLVIVEGEKKTLAGVQHDICCVALAGVWSWREKGDNGKAKVIDDFNRIFWKKRKVYIVFDSDSQVKADVKEAELALAKELRRRGAIVEAIRIPPGPNGEKVGLDDYLLNHSPEAFWSLPTDSLDEKQEKAVMSLAEFMVHPFPVIPSLIGDGVITAASLDSIVGRAKLGKTWLTTQAALCLSGMSSYFISEHLKVHQFGRVLYVNAEVAAFMFQRRLGLILAEAKNKGLNIDLPRKNFFPVTVRGSMRLDRKEGQNQLIKLCEQVKPMLIVVDPIGALHYTEENSQKDMGRLLNFLLSVVEYFNAAMIVVHHMGKSTENREEIHFGRGSSVWGDRVDSNLNLMPYGEQGTATRLKLSFTLRNGPPLDPLIVRRGEGEFLYSAVGQADDTAEWLEDLLASEGRIEREVAWDRYKASGRTGEKAFKKALRILESQGKMTRKGEGFPCKTYLVYTVGTTFKGVDPTA